MPKRIIDGDAMWASDKIAKCSSKIPANSGVYYPWFFPLADANGVLELTNLRVVHQKIAVNLPFLLMKHVKKILKDFESRGLLFVWSFEGKRYGYWTGADKCGRLPKPSDRSKYQNHEVSIPSKRLAEYEREVKRGDLLAPKSPQKGEWFGVGLGVGLDGIGINPANISVQEGQQFSPNNPLPDKPSGRTKRSRTPEEQKQNVEARDERVRKEAEVRSECGAGTLEHALAVLGREKSF